MKKNIFKFLVLSLVAALCLGLASCSELLDKLPFEIPGLGGGNNGDDNGADQDSESLVLIEDKVAKFQIVYTNDAGSKVIKRAEEFVEQLRALGIEINDPIRDSDKNISDCEIIIGTSVKNRDDELVVTQRELGKDGLLVKIVGQKILIAGGTDELTISLFENYMKEEMKITKKTESLDSLAVNSDYSYERATNYRVNSITLGGVNIKEYTLIYDTKNLSIDLNGAIKSFREQIYNISGAWLPEGTVEKENTYEHCFIFRYTDNAGENGFRIFEKDGDFIVECCYQNAFERTFEDFAKKVFYNTTNNTISLPENYSYEVDVTKASYSDFGAKGDGITDDYAAILATHEYANEGGQKVYGTYGATYYIDPKSFTKSIPVATDVDFCGAAFIIDDRGDDAFENRGKALFLMEYTEKPQEIKVSNILTEALEFDGVAVSVPAGTTSISWIVPYLQSDLSMVRITNQNKKDYIRYGANQNSGTSRHEMLLVDKEGNIDESTDVFFDYEKLTDITIYRCDDKPITIENGEFYTICCQAELVNHPKYGGITSYQAYKRGLMVSRSNVTIKNLNHKMVDQPEVLSNKDDENGSYPYGGFIRAEEAYNLLVEDCVLAGHTTYYERKAATESSGGVGSADNFVPAGSYDFRFGDSTHITFINVDQENIDYTMDETHNITAENGGYDNGIGDNRYWGIMCSDFVRNLRFEDCYISRIDAHMGFFNIDVINSTIGHTFHAIGGGRLYVENMVRLAGDSYITTRGDYGGSFKGEITIKNGELAGYRSYNSSSWYSGYHSFEEVEALTSGQYSDGYILNLGYNQTNDSKGTYFEWDFGYPCYMPQTLILEGTFKSSIQNIYISSKDYHDYWTIEVPKILAENPDYKPYELIKRIIYRNWTDKTKIFEINQHAANPNIGNENDYMATHCEVIIE